MVFLFLRFHAIFFLLGSAGKLIRSVGSAVFSAKHGVRRDEQRRCGLDEVRPCLKFAY